MSALKQGWRLLAAATLLSIPLAAHASDTRETRAFKVQLPAGWEKQIKEEPSKDGKMGTWTFVSPSRNVRVFIRIGANRPGPIAAQWDAFVGERLGQTLLKLHPEGFWQKKADDGEVAYGTVYGLGRRNKTGHVYKYGIVVMRNPKHKRVVYIAVGGTKDGWGAASARLDRIMNSLELK